jgi:hypothetical protein
VDDLVVHADADAGGIPAVAQERGLRAGPLDEAEYLFVDLLGADARADHLPRHAARACGDLSCLSHLFDIPGRLDHN